MMIAVTIDREWFEEIKERVAYENPYFYNDERWGEQVEVDVDEESFIEVSAELGYKW